MSHRTSARRAGPLAVLAIACAACFSERADITDPGDCTTLVQNATVEIRDYEFVPAVVCLEPGGTVTWINKGAVTHTSTSVRTPSIWDSGFLAQNQQYARTFTASGTFEYLCTPHPFMRGTIVVGTGMSNDP